MVDAPRAFYFGFAGLEVLFSGLQGMERLYILTFWREGMWYFNCKVVNFLFTGVASDLGLAARGFRGISLFYFVGFSFGCRWLLHGISGLRRVLGVVKEWLCLRSVGLSCFGSFRVLI